MRTGTAKTKTQKDVSAYEPIPNIRKILADVGALKALEADIKGLGAVIGGSDGTAKAMAAIC